MLRQISEPIGLTTSTIFCDTVCIIVQYATLRKVSFLLECRICSPSQRRGMQPHECRKPFRQVAYSIFHYKWKKITFRSSAETSILCTLWHFSLRFYGIGMTKYLSAHAPKLFSDSCDLLASLRSGTERQTLQKCNVGANCINIWTVCRLLANSMS